MGQALGVGRRGLISVGCSRKASTRSKDLRGVESEPGSIWRKNNQGRHPKTGIDFTGARNNKEEKRKKYNLSLFSAWYVYVENPKESKSMYYVTNKHNKVTGYKNSV